MSREIFMEIVLRTSSLWQLLLFVQPCYSVEVQLVCQSVDFSELYNDHQVLFSLHFAISILKCSYYHCKWKQQT